MIRGAVNSRFEAIVPIRVRGPGGAELDFDAVVDTGFTASLALPATAVAALGLLQQSRSEAVLADGVVRKVDVCAAEVNWNGQWRPVLVLSVGDEMLLGMRLLSGHELRIAVEAGGPVEITSLP